MLRVINYILGLGAAVFLPVIMIIIGLIMKMKPKKAIMSGITLGIAFTGINLVLNFMLESISPAASQFVKNTGITLTAIDAGWPTMSSIAWAWPAAVIMFPIQIIINIVMLAFGWTNCLNVDLWNVWGKIFTATIVTSITGNIFLGLIAGGIQVVFELKNADITQKQIYRLTKIPGVACPHQMLIQGALMAPINKLFDYIPGLRSSNLDANKLKSKIGIFGENSVMGFIVGALIAIFAGYGLKDILNTAIKVGTALVFFPMAAKLFMQALAPIADAAGNYMKKRFKGREFYIGLDWPFLAGQSELWVATIILVPIELLLAVFLNKLGANNVLPLASLINISVVTPALIVTGGNLIRMLIIGIIFTPVYLIVATNFTNIITNLGRNAGAVKAGQVISWFGIELPEFRYSIAHALNIVHGDFIGLILFISYILIFIWYSKYMKKRDESFEMESQTK
ncbi:PTS galactitol transporter subunit IIC [Acidilutibacter cellobiosedens]|jgi:PTS system galactitol-specific IIC component|uniref:PTS galactitol transporter subunit IIC n=1 Tax=Acidilutibacter cellobiosedens TaxID=2507161 RepID=A0A410QAL8_9FIRM|nr:PTS transporter subunit IIC [Acidilutibacter cellobiosedens]QAT61051.1 PTS galactitol transporter subunit IIC [Acidilutibacter cellobiosedens]